MLSMVVTGLFIGLLSIFVLAILWEQIVFKRFAMAAPLRKIVSAIAAWLTAGTGLAMIVVGSAGASHELTLGALAAGYMGFAPAAVIVAAIGFFGARRETKNTPMSNAEISSTFE